MSNLLVIWLQATGRMQWMSLSPQGRPVSGPVSGAPDASESAAAQRIVVLVPSEDVVWLDLPPLAGGRGQVTKAVPYALEDRLAGPVEDLHFALPERLENRAGLAGAVVARETMRGWLQSLNEAGIRADAVYAESQLLPCSDMTGCVLLEADRALWRFGPTQAGACELGGLNDRIAVLQASDRELPEFEVFDFRDAPAIDLPCSRYHAKQRDALAFLSSGLTPEPQINLLQGEFAPVHRHAPLRKLWQQAAMLAAAAVVLAFAYQVVDYWRLSRQSAQFEAATRATLHAAFPQMDKVAGDPRQLMQSQLSALHDDGDSTGLLHLLSRIAPILGSTTRVTLTGIEYHNATLELALRAPDVPALDLIREQLSDLPGLTAQVTAANSGDNGIDGRLRVSGAGR